MASSGVNFAAAVEHRLVILRANFERRARVYVFSYYEPERFLLAVDFHRNIAHADFVELYLKVFPVSCRFCGDNARVAAFDVRNFVFGVVRVDGFFLAERADGDVARQAVELRGARPCGMCPKRQAQCYCGQACDEHDSQSA